MKLLAAFLLGSFALSATITGDVKRSLAMGDMRGAEALLNGYKRSYGETPEYVQAYSWLARGALDARKFEQAERLAKETKRLVAQQLKSNKLDRNTFLENALGAAIEVEGLALAATGQHNEALSYLKQELAAYPDAAVRTRTQKNINLLSLEGKPAPPLDVSHWLGPKPPTLASLKGKPVLLFFWAHWCGDCRNEIPIIVRIKQEFAPRGLVLLGPTQHYGYAAGGNDATPEVETKYIEQVRNLVYGSLYDVPSPLSEQNFKTYGASTTPTLVLIDKRGIVALYHPGAISYEELSAAIRKVL